MRANAGSLLWGIASLSFLGSTNLRAEYGRYSDSAFREQLQESARQRTERDRVFREQLQESARQRSEIERFNREQRTQPRSTTPYYTPSRSYRPELGQVEIVEIQGQARSQPRYVPDFSDVIPNEAPFGSFKLPQKGCQLSFSVGMRFGHIDGERLKYYFDNFEAAKKNGFTVTVSYLDQIERIEETFHFGVDDRKYYKQDLAWQKPKRTNLEQERKALAYQKTVKEWQAWGESKNTQLAEAKASFERWKSEKEKQLAQEADENLVSVLKEKLNLYGAQFEVQSVEVESQLRGVVTELQKATQTTQDFVSLLTSPKKNVDERMEQLAGSVRSDFREPYDQFASRERKVLQFRKDSMDSWLTSKRIEIQKWYDSQKAKSLAEPLAAVEEWSQSYRKIVDSMPETDLKARVIKKLTDEEKRRRNQLSSNSLGTELATLLEQDLAVMQSVYDEFLNDYRTTLTVTESQANWVNTRDKMEAEHAERAKLWLAKVSELKKGWNEFPTVDAVIATQKKVVTELSVIKEGLQQDRATFESVINAVNEATGPVYTVWNNSETKILESLIPGPFKEDTRQVFLAEKKRRDAFLRQRKQQVVVEQGRRAKLYQTLSDTLAARVETGAAAIEAKALLAIAIEGDQEARRNFQAAYDKTFWDEKTYPGLAVIAPSIETKFPWDLKVPDTCKVHTLKLEKDGGIALYYENRSLLEFDRGDFISLSCVEKSIALVLAKARVTEKTQHELSTDANREPSSTQKIQAPILLLYNGDRLNLIYSAETETGRLDQVWFNDDRLMVREKQSAETFHHSFSLKGEDHDIVGKSEAPQSLPGLLERIPK